MTTASAHPIDIGIFVVFLIVNLIVGLRYGRGLSSMRHYAIGNKDFTTATLTATIVVSWIGGSDVFYILQHTYLDGLYFAIVMMGASICLLLVGQLTTRMGRFLNSLSVAEAMGDLYGTAVRVVTAISGVLSVIGVVAIEFQVIGEIMTLLLGFTSNLATVLAAAIVILYSVSGGVRAVTFTDVLQFFVFGTFIPLIALVIWHHLQDPHQVASMLSTNPNFNLHKVIGWHPKFLKSLAMLGWFAIPALDPVVFQRISMSRNVLQAKESFQYAGMISMLANLFMIWVAILLLSSNSTLEPSRLFTHIIGNYAATGLRGCISIGVIALAMSTADSYLNAAAVLLANDIVKPLRIKPHREIFVTQTFCLACGILALVLSLYASGLLEILLFSNSFYMPIVTVPLLLAILGFRSSTRAVLLGMGAGFTTVVLWSICFTNADSIFPGMLANLIGLMGSHYLLGEPGGWQQAAPGSPLALARTVRRQAWQRRIRAIRAFRLYPYLQKNIPAQESFYFFFGLYTIAATYAAFYTIGNADVQAYQPIYTGIYHTVLPITTTFLTFPIWPPTIKSKRFTAFFWPISIGAILFFAGTLLVIMSHYHHLQVMIMMINTLMAVLLLRWPLALFLAAAGIALAVVFFAQYTGASLPTGELVGSLQLKIMYGLLLLTSFLIALFKGKQAYRQLEVSNKNLAITHQETAYELLLAFQDKARFSQAFRNSGAPTLTRLTILSREIREALKKFTLPLSVRQKIDELNEQLAPIAIQLDRLDHRATSYLRLEVTNIAVDALLADFQDKLHDKGIDKGIRVIKMTRQTTVQCDVDRIKALLMNSVTFLSNVVGEEQPILISLEDTQLGYSRPSVKKDYIKTIASLSITITTEQVSPKLEAHYMAHMNRVTTSTPQNTQELPLATNKRIVEAHYGYINTVVQDDSCTLRYVIPADLSEVRPKDMDDPHMELAIELRRADDTYPGAQAQEQAFLEEVAKRTQADLDLVRKAIETIKYYHGPQMRNSGEPFYLHPLSVAQIVLDYNQEEATVLGALLHDTVEDTPMLLENIEMMFNKEVARIVDGVTHLDSNKETFYKLKLSAHENTRKLLEVADKRALYVKLADRMHNMRTIQVKPYEHQRRTAEETLLFFVPLSEKLGLVGVAEELKERCFAVLNGKLEVSGVV
ncbi:MAG: sodium:solute symporter family protein [Bacteroidota bacterium]